MKMCRSTVRSESGQLLIYAMTTATLVQSVNMAVDLLNTRVSYLRQSIAAG